MPNAKFPPPINGGRKNYKIAKIYRSLSNIVVILIAMRKLARLVNLTTGSEFYPLARITHGEKVMWVKWSVSRETLSRA